MPNLLLIENIRGSFVVTPYIEAKKQEAMTGEFWDENDLRFFVDEFFINPYATYFAFETIRTQNALNEAAGLWVF